MATKTTISWEEFLASGGEGQRWEWIDGEVTHMTPASFRHEMVLRRLIAYIEDYCRSHPDWDWVPSNAVFTMSSGNWRLPDVSMFKKARLTNGVIPETRAEFAPDVSFEILSPGNSPSYIQRKRKDYRESGVIQVWIDPEKQFIELIYPDRPLEYAQEGEFLTIADVPEFSLEVKSLFAF
ncbi:MAG TPA: Uma2 family endonuclease [Terriglobia bacterium]|nr:Uma2 family endonuclease [Terriglobia bacterium]